MLERKLFPNIAPIACLEMTQIPPPVALILDIESFEMLSTPNIS